MNSNIDFDIDDPLADVLSDRSDDSFFEDKDKFIKPSRNSSLDKKKSSLFGLDNEKNKEESTSLSKGDWLGLVDSPVKSKPTTAVNPKENEKVKDSKQNVQTSVKTKSVFSAESLNILDDLGLPDSEAQVPPKTSNTSFMDDILGLSKKSSKVDITVPLKSESTPKTGYNPTGGSTKTIFSKPNTAVLKLDEENVVEDSKPKSTKIKNTSKKENIGKRQRSTDWLGLFPDQEILKEPSKGEDLPFSELLNPQNSSKKETPPIEQIENTKETVNKDHKTNNPSIDLNPLMGKNLLGGNLILGNNATMQIMSNTEIEQQSAAICLQQQQSQLMVALQLKAQEESLAALHEQREESRRIQDEVVSAHREQLEQLLKGQSEHRTNLNNIMMQHQQRINEHIQALLKPSTSSKHKDVDQTITSNNEVILNRNDDKDMVEERIRPVSEKEQLENMIINLKENHSKELDILENSYRHQLQLINESLTSIEDRLRNENENLSSYYLKRIEKLEEENITLMQQGNEKIKVLQEKAAVEREEAERKHRRNMEILHEQNQTVITNIKETMALERSTLKDASEYSNKLEYILRDVEKNNTICNSYVDKINTRHNEDVLSRETILALKEKQVTILLENLETNRNALENESQEMRNNLRNWEERLQRQNKIIDEEKLSLKLMKAEIENEKEIHLREKEKLDIMIENEKENMKKNIESIHAKYTAMEKDLSDKRAKLEEDRLKLEREHKNIEDVKNLNEELKRKLESELSDIREKKKSIATTQGKLLESETALSARYQELETLTKSALLKHNVAEQKINESNYMQQRFEDKLKELQEHALSLSTREQQIARDKVALSRERLTFYNMQKEFQCSLCKSSNINSLIDINKYASIPNQYRNINLNPDITGQLSPDKDIVKRKDILKRNNINNTQRSLSQMENISEKLFHSLDSSKEYNKPLSAFQEIVDPKLLLMKLDIQNAVKYKTDE